MFRYRRELILPFFLQKRMTVAELARKAGVGQNSAQRALNGEKVSAVIIGKIADALGIEAMEFLEEKTNMFTKQTVTITKDDGTKKNVEISVSDSEKTFSIWSEDEQDFNKAFTQYFSERKKENEI